jgi:hypothetical protein
MSVPDLDVFHLGIVVRDVESASALYGRLLGINRWRWRESVQKAPPWSDWMTDAHLKTAYGRGSGQTIELVQVIDGQCTYSKFLEEHGEGVQHIGFWCKDMKAAVEAAVAEGAKILNATVDEQQKALLQLSPQSPTSDVVAALDAGGFAYLDMPMGGVQLEFLGPNVGVTTGLRRFLAEQHEKDPAS